MPPSGKQFQISYGKQSATIVEVGGGIRAYEADGQSVLDSYPVTAMCDGGHGTPLVPWPNRIADGQYRFEGTRHQLPLTEPDKRNAIHGLLRWRNWAARMHEPERVVMGIHLHPSPGYPFELDVTVAYELGMDGLSVSLTSTNTGSTACPYAVGHHPYLAVSSGHVDRAVLTVPAHTRLLTDPERQLPTGPEAVDGTPFDFREGRQIEDLVIDHGFTDLVRGPDGRAWVRLSEGREPPRNLWVDPAFPVLGIYTGDTLAPARRRTSLAVEPMSAGANCFQSGEGLLTLAPGETHRATWGACLG